MRKTKIVFICIALTLLLIISSACGSAQSSSANGKTPIISSDSSSETTKSASKPASTTKNQDVKWISIDEQVLLERDGIVITAKGFSEGIFGPEIKILIENNSDTNITVQARDFTVNGVMVEPMLSADAVAGKKINDSITIMSSYLEAAKIDIIKDISLKFHIFSTDDWETIFDTEQISFVVNKDVNYTQEFDDSGEEVLNHDGFRIIAKKLDDEERFWGTDLNLYVENTSGKDATIQVRDVSVNGFMIDPMFSCDVLDGMRAFDSVTFMEEDFEENDISDVETLELSFHIFESEGWDTIFDSESITINFK